MRFFHVQADAANEFVGRHVEHAKLGSGRLQALYEGTGIVLRVRVRDAQGGRRHFFRAQQAREGRDVAIAIGTQKKPLCPEFHGSIDSTDACPRVLELAYVSRYNDLTRCGAASI